MAEQSRAERTMEKQRIWQSHIEAWKSSGMSQVDYCQANDLSRHRFTYWKCKLTKREEPVRFVPIPGEGFGSQIPNNNHSRLRLILDSRYEIEIGDGFSPGTLSSLIYTLGRL